MFRFRYSCFNGNGKNINFNQKGSVILLAIMILSIISLLGISSHHTSFTDIIIINNQLKEQKSFYNAQSVAAVGMESFMNLEPDLLKTELIKLKKKEQNTIDYLHLEQNIDIFNISASSNWFSPTSTNILNKGAYLIVHIENNSNALNYGSMIMTINTNNFLKPYYFIIFARSVFKGSESIVEMGFSKILPDLEL